MSAAFGGNIDEKFFRNLDRALEHTLDRKFEAPPRSGGKPGEPVPEVDPEDIKAVWREHREMQGDYLASQLPSLRECFSTTARPVRTCRPSATVRRGTAFSSS